MQISINWLKDFVDIDPKLSHKELAELITIHTAEVEGVHELGHGFKNMVVGRIKTIKPHPNADKLTVTGTDIGSGEIKQIVCGAKNIHEGMLVPVALPGAMVKWHGEGDPVELKPASLRGVESFGMLCAGEEIGLESKEDGIYDLSTFGVKEGTPLSKVFGYCDSVLEMDNKAITHRPDLWGHYGIAREVAAITGKKFKQLKPLIKFPVKGEKLNLQIKDFELCPRYCGLIISNVKVEESPKWLKDRLTAVGYRPISNIVDATNYVMAELGQPMHAFDKSYIKGGIIVRRAKKDEKITTLDGVERILDETMLVISDHEKPVAIAGVMGGENSEINNGTTEIILESANFRAENIRKTSTKLGIRTEAVQRFEKALDPLMAETAIKRLAELILKLCPDAKVTGPLADSKKFNTKKTVVNVDIEKLCSKIGVKISLARIKKILKSLEFGVTQKSAKVLKVTVPSFRATKDIDIQDDLVEEVVRLYGYDNVKEIMPSLPIRLPLYNKERALKHQARRLLSYMFGMQEVFNYSYYGHDEMKKSLIDAEKFDREHIKLENFLSAEQTHLKISLVPNLLKNVVSNLRYFSEFKLYEVGRVYSEVGEFFPLEEKWIGGVVVNKGKNSESPFFKVKKIVEEFLKIFLKMNFEIVKAKDEPPYCHPSRSARVMVEGKAVGGIFEVHPQVLKNWGIDAETAMFELNFTQLCTFNDVIAKYEPIPKFPGLEIDVSVVLENKVKAEEAENAIRSAEKDLIARIKLFDIYKGENIERGKKALAYRILLQSKDRTLTDIEMSGIQKKIFENLQKLGGVIRGI